MSRSAADLAKSRRNPDPVTEKAWLAAVRKVASGSGWQQKRGVLFRQEGDWFVAGHLRPHEGGQHAEILAKPLALDPMLWRDMGLEANEKQPLSFRYWGAFICGTPVIDTRPMPPTDTAELRARKLIATLDEMRPDLMQKLQKRPFSDFARNPAGIHDNWRMGNTAMYALRNEARIGEAKKQAREMLDAGEGGFAVSDRIASAQAGKTLPELALERMGETPKSRGWLGWLTGRRP